jgi:hypothetical protein
MYSAKVHSSQTLYTKVNQFLAHVVPHAVVLQSRSDYRDPTLVKITLDFGRYNVDLKEHDIRMQVEHRAPDGDTEACLVMTSESFEMNMKMVNLAMSATVRSPDERVVPVFAWDNGWHQKQAVWVSDHKASKTQQKVVDDIDWFYGNGKFHQERNLPFQRGMLISGPSASGKHWIIRHVALKHAKSLAYIPVTEHTYGVIGPALACAPLGSIIVMDNLAQFFSIIPPHEKGTFLRHLETAFNTSANDPRGLVVIALMPGNIDPQLEKFLRMPHRFQRKFDLSLAGTEALSAVIAKGLPELPEDKIASIAATLGKANVSENVLAWFFATQENEDPKPGVDELVAKIQDLAVKVKDERTAIDTAGQPGRERLYS